MPREQSLWIISILRSPSCLKSLPPALKASDALTRPNLAAFILLGYAMAYYFLALAVRTLALALAYATWACTGIF
jgi:multidrug transporter EmrE-like cation transporter